MWNHKGFFMVDLLLSLSCWMLISVTILPIGIQFMENSMDEKEEYAATVLLYEKLQEMIVEGEVPTAQKIIKNEKQYDMKSNLETKEVCIQFENRNQKKYEVCEYWE
ncbi:phosphatase [Bacillus sp. CGMCC 1.16607]|uniref:phosphatase n=1 Tax=Bacillus sp. CGMCC 1.16607 TaxID=3351842 RepID=UPI003625A50C